MNILAAGTIPCADIIIKVYSFTFIRNKVKVCPIIDFYSGDIETRPKRKRSTAYVDNEF